MTKYIFLNMPASGHVNPTLAVVQELVQRGHEVSYYLTEEFRDTVQATGATFHPYTSMLSGQMMPSRPSFGSSASLLTGLGAILAQEANYVPPQVIDSIRAEQPDVMIYDFMCIWAQSIIEALNVPTISVRATYASNEHFNLFDQIRKTMVNDPGQSEVFQNMFKSMAEQTGGAGHPAAAFLNMLTRVEALNILFIPREFQPAGETFDDRYVFVGPSIFPRHQTTPFPFDQLKPELPLLYISLGSMISNQLAFYQSCFAAFGEQPWQVILSIGKQTDLASLGPVPENFILSAYAPQLEILQRAPVFVTHAGTNSIMEGLYYGVPMVMLPQQPEQQLHAQRTVELGAGLMLEKETVTASMLREAVELIAQNASYRAHAQQMQQIVRAAGGYQRAADAIVQFTEIPNN